MKLLKKVRDASFNTSKNTLINLSFIEYAKTVLSLEEVQYILDSFGYYSELVIMNAYDCLKLIKELDNKNRFYSLSGGLSQVINELVNRIKKMGGKIILSYNVENINCGSKNSSTIRIKSSNGVYMSCQKCICTMTSSAIQSIPFFKSIGSLLRNVKCTPLCRIYAKYDTENGVWFKNMSRFTTNNELRMVIPISESEGVIMISYTDNKYSEFWKNIYDNYGKRGLNRELRRLIQESTGLSIPIAKSIEFCYWSCGVGYWGLGADSTAISERIICPFSDDPMKKNVFICNENFSVLHQQWMEGSLEMGSRVLSLL